MLRQLNAAEADILKANCLERQGNLSAISEIANAGYTAPADMRAGHRLRPSRTGRNSEAYFVICFISPRAPRCHCPSGASVPRGISPLSSQSLPAATWARGLSCSSRSPPASRARIACRSSADWRRVCRNRPARNARNPASALRQSMSACPSRPVRIRAWCRR